MRVGAQHGARVGQSHLARAPPGAEARPGRPGTGADRCIRCTRPELPADRERRAQAGERVLEDHPPPYRPRKASQGRLVQRVERVLPGEP